MEVNTLTVIVSIISAIIVGGMALFGYGFKFGKDIQKLTEDISNTKEKLTENMTNMRRELTDSMNNMKNELIAEYE
jgi:predicted PurR-regulated permease PerM